MHIILGGTGHLGSATARALLAMDEPVVIVSRTARERDAWRQRGAQLVVADIHDTAALREVFRRGTRAYLLNPPADPSTDTDVEERSTVRSILHALEGVELEQIVAASTTGARRGDRIGDFNVLFELEQGLKQLPGPVQIIRGGYYMSNWDNALAAARDTGELHTMFPADLAIPMVAPEDLGEAAARLLSSPRPGSACARSKDRDRTPRTMSQRRSHVRLSARWMSSSRRARNGLPLTGSWASPSRLPRRMRA